MIFDRPLTPEEQKRSQKNYKKFLLLNGFAYMCLGETVIILLAVRMGCPDWVIAGLGAMVYFGFLLLPLGKFVASRMGAAASQSFFWVARNMAGYLVVIAVPISLMQYNITSQLLVLLGGFFFYGFRAAGVILSQPLIGEITAPAERSSFVSQNSIIGIGSGCLALLMIGILCRLTENIWALTAVAFIGSSTGLFASRYVKKVDESNILRDSAKRPLLPELRNIWQIPDIRRQVTATFIVHLSTILYLPVSLLAVKRGFGISDGTAIFFSFFQWIACIAGSYLCAKVTRKLGPRRVAILSYLTVLGMTPLWYLLTEMETLLFSCLLLVPFILGGVCRNMMENSMTHYFLQTVDGDKRVAVSLLISTTAGAGAGIVGLGFTSLVFGLLDKTLQYTAQTGTFQVYFILTGILLAPGLLFLSRLTPLPFEKRIMKKSYLDFLW